MNGAALVVVLAASLCTPTQVRDQTVRKAIALYQQLSFREALALLEKALHSGDLSRLDRQQALAYLGRLHAVLEHPVSAQWAFVRVLRLDPDFRISREESPLIQTVFQRARLSPESRSHAEPEPSIPPASDPQPIDLQLQDPKPQDPKPEAKPTPMVLSPTVEPPAPPLAATQPPNGFEVTAEPQAEQSHRWLWIILGGVGAAAVTTGVILFATQTFNDTIVETSAGRWDLP